MEARLTVFVGLDDIALVASRSTVTKRQPTICRAALGPQLPIPPTGAFTLAVVNAGADVGLRAQSSPKRIRQVLAVG